MELSSEPGAQPAKSMHDEQHASQQGKIPIERVQIGARMEKRLVKVLKALAEYFDMSLGDLLEGIALHAFEHPIPFSEETLKRIAQLKAVYGVDYDASASHRFIERNERNERSPDDGDNPDRPENGDGTRGEVGA